jgi:SulP family sulfate permease
LREEDGDEEGTRGKRTIPPGVEVFEIRGSLFFGAIEQFRDAVQRIEEPPRVLILQMSEVLNVDSTGLQDLEDLWKRLTAHGTVLILVGVRAQPLFAMQRAGFLGGDVEEAVAGDLDEALERAAMIVGRPTP